MFWTEEEGIALAAWKQKGYQVSEGLATLGERTGMNAPFSQIFIFLFIHRFT